MARGRKAPCLARRSPYLPASARWVCSAGAGNGSKPPDQSGLCGRENPRVKRSGFLLTQMALTMSAIGTKRTKMDFVPLRLVRFWLVGGQLVRIFPTRFVSMLTRRFIRLRRRQSRNKRLSRYVLRFYGRAMALGGLRRMPDIFRIMRSSSLRSPGASWLRHSS